jgi:hypothetical protein
MPGLITFSASDRSRRPVLRAAAQALALQLHHQDAF